MKDLWNAFLNDESGQGLVEYVLIIAMIAVGLIAVLALFRDDIGELFGDVATEMNNAPTQAPAAAYPTGS
jgi:pilus assembly protein Flp/PilA